MGRKIALAVLLAACGGSDRAATAPSPQPSAPVAPPARDASPPADASPQAQKKDEEPRMTTFADDLAFLEKHGRPLVLSGDGDAKIALSAEYQGRVMTSGASSDGRSLGWINRSFIEAKKTGTQFDNFGGEDRFWLGPEGGQFGLYFPPGAKFEFDAWQTPHAMQEGAWDVVGQDARKVTFRRAMKVTNWSKTTFDVDVTRTIRVLGKDDAQKHLGIAPGKAAFVAYESVNEVKNAGKEKWTKPKGLLSAWILAMYAPVPDTRVVIPFEKGPEGKLGRVVNDAYFGKVPADRLEVRADEGVLFFKCDGKHRSKIGLGPKRAKNVLGSYSAEAKLLTIVSYDRPTTPGAPYVDSMWQEQKDPYGGDVVNSYNDGPPAPGKPPLGGFYELETSSPGLELAPGGSATHTHRTFHFVGEPAELEPVAKKVLGVSLAEIAASLSPKK